MPDKIRGEFVLHGWGGGGICEIGIKCPRKYGPQGLNFREALVKRVAHESHRAC